MSRGCSLWRCPGAKDPVSECECSCGGRNHGARRGGGANQEAEKRASKEREKQEVKARQRPGAGRLSVPRPSLRMPRSFWGVVVTGGAALVGISLLVKLVAAIVTALVTAVTATVAAFMIGAEVAAPWIAIVSLAALVGVTIDWAHVRAWHGRRREVRTALTERRERVRVETAQAIAIEPVADLDMQEWIEKGLRTRRLDGYVPEPVHRR